MNCTVQSRFNGTFGVRKCIMLLNQMILGSKLKNGLWKIVSKSQVVTKFTVTILRQYTLDLMTLL